jgi:hypothetical protein
MPPRQRGCNRAASLRRLTSNPPACIAARRAPARRYWAASRRGCPAALATAPGVARYECAAQAVACIAAAAALSLAGLAPAALPQRERVAITTLLQHLFEGEAPGVFDGPELRLGVKPRLQHGGQHGKIFCVVLFGIFHGQALPFSRRVWAPEFFLRAIGDGRAPERFSYVKRETGSVKGKGGVVPAFRSSLRPVSPDQASKKANEKRMRNAVKRRS